MTLVNVNIIHIHIFILCDTYPTWEIDKDMVKVSIDVTPIF